MTLNHSQNNVYANKVINSGTQNLQTHILCEIHSDGKEEISL